METIETNVQLLIWSIKRSPEYKEYKRREARLQSNSELWHRVTQFRARNFQLQKAPEDDHIFEVMDQLEQEAEELHRIPEAHAYLQAELEICRLVQEVTMELAGGLDIHIPNEQGEDQ